MKSAISPSLAEARTFLADLYEEQGKTLASDFNQVATDITSLRQSSAQAVTTGVAQVNSTASEVAGLNSAIRNATNAGMQPNALIDQRNMLIDQLSKSVGATTRDTYGFGSTGR